MPVRLVYAPHTLRFRKEAGTSRGILTEKTSWIIKATDTEMPGTEGWGECGPLPGLSLDDLPDFEKQLDETCRFFNDLETDVFPFNLNIILDQLVPAHLPSVRFGMETALLDLMNGGSHTIFKTDFAKGSNGILMNGLIWMGTYDQMLSQVEEKLSQGFKTLKMKVGAIDFEKECAILEQIRTRYSAEEITLRVDANGAFTADNVRERLHRLAAFDLHSIEQPVKAGQTELMASLCADTPLAIALDEELIAAHDYRSKFALLKKISPQFIILKPTLLGGLSSCDEWIEIANRLHIGWWITSALESNIGLNAIAQYTASKQNPLPQGLGTGQLFTNNIDSPLVVRDGKLYYDKQKDWDLNPVNTFA